MVGDVVLRCLNGNADFNIIEADSRTKIAKTHFAIFEPK